MPTLFIDKNILKDNIEITKELAGEAHIIGVVKGNGYGLGLCSYARILEESGIETLAVTEIGDAVKLRNAGIHCDILMLSPLYQKKDIATALTHYILLSIPSCECGEIAEQTAAELNIYARCHICVDTGFSRYGFMDNRQKDIIYTIHRMKHICVTGIYSHFYASSCKKSSHTIKQFERFTALCDAIEKENEFVGYRHIAASCALLRYPDTKLDAVRIGSAFLGRLPFPDQWGYKPVGQLEAAIQEIRTLPVGTGIGYGHTFTTAKQTTIAIVSAGYIHGLGIRCSYNCPGFFHLPQYLYHLLKSTLPAKPLYAYYGNQCFPVIGKIGMNSLAIDITGAKFSIGDIVRFPINPLYVNSSIPRVY